MKILGSKLCLISAAMMLTISFSAEAQRRRGGTSSQGPANQQIAHRVQRYMNNGDRINLTRVFQDKIGRNQKVVAIKVVAQSTSRNSKIVLKSNGQRLAVINLNLYSNPQVLNVPSYVNLSNLVMVVKGSAFVQRVIAKTKSKNQGRAQLLKAQINVNTSRDGGVIQVKNIVKQQTGVAIGDKNIVAVVFKAKAKLRRNGSVANAKVQLMVAGYPTGPVIRLGSVLQRHVINLRGINTKRSSVKLKILGKAQIKMIGVKIKGLNF